MEHNTKRNIIRALEIILVFGVALAILLYALGYYDFTFIDREAIFGGDKVQLPSATQPESDPAGSGDNTDSVNTPVEEEPVANTSLVFDSAELPDVAAQVGALTDGYYVDRKSVV